MHAVLANVFGVDRPECSGADMQRDKGVRNFIQNFLCEMESRGGRRHRAGRSREYSLITRLVFLVAVAAEVWRQRHRTAGVKIDIFENDDALAVRADFFDARNHVVDLRRRADSHLSPGSDEAFPAQRPKPFGKQEIDRAVVGQSPRREHARVVQNQKIAR